MADIDQPLSNLLWKRPDCEEMDKIMNKRAAFWVFQESNDSRDVSEATKNGIKSKTGPGAFDYRIVKYIGAIWLPWVVEVP